MTPPDDGTKRRADDADLRAAFSALRTEDAAGAPPFEAVLAAGSRRGTHRRRPWLVPALTGAMAAAALAVAIVAVARRPEPRLAPPVSIERWTAPTDFLLETPGRELLETVPSIGEVPEIGPLDGAEKTAKRRSVAP